MLIQEFIKGGPIMWPILVLSIVTLGVIIERVFFLVQALKRRDSKSVQAVLDLCENDRFEDAMATANASSDPIAGILAQGLDHRFHALQDALIEASSQVLEQYNRGLVVLDTAVTLGPLLGLLGTVTGMMKAFGVVGSGGIADKQMAITGGIAEALIAVTFGLCVAIAAIVPLNYFGAKLETQRRLVESAVNRFTVLLGKKTC